jgi:hypothetical protein
MLVAFRVFRRVRAGMEIGDGELGDSDKVVVMVSSRAINPRLTAFNTRTVYGERDALADEPRDPRLSQRLQPARKQKGVLAQNHGV